MMKNSNSTENKSIILLSGGLDSVVSLACAKDDYNITMALTFDYGQRSCEQEIKSAFEISKFYNIEHKIIKLDWLANITKTSLVNTDEQLPELDNSELDTFEKTKNSAKKVWVPNRNGLFINIAGCFADSYNFTHIIFGANKEEAVTFSDNSEKFIRKINKSLKYSTCSQTEVFAPLIDCDKKEIVKVALEKNVPLRLIRSCYTNNDRHCGKCESCLRLKRALLELCDKATIDSIFGE